MTYKIQGEQPFQVLASNFSIGPSNEGYTLQISADGKNYSDLFSVGANVTRMVTGVANGSYYRLSGNNSLVTVNWNKQCSDGQGGGGGGSTYILPPATDRTLGGIKVGSGLTVQADGTLSAEGGSGSAAYKIELSTSNPDDFTQDDIDNLNAFFAAVEEDPSIIDTAYVYSSDIFRCTSAFYDASSHSGDFVFVAAYENFINEFDLSFVDGEYTEGFFYENNFNTIFPYGGFPADPVEGQIANHNDGQGNIGLYRYDGTDWVPFGGGDNTILKVSSSMPSGASVGDVYAIHSESSSTQTWSSDITTGFTQFRVPLNATSECSLQGFHMGGDTYYTDLWWHGEDDPKRWDMRGTATNFEVITLNTEFTYTANTNTITAAIDGDYVVVTLSQPVTEYNVVDGIEIMNEVIIPEKNDVYQVANKNAYDVATTLIDSRIDGSTTLAKGVKIEINTPPSADTIVTNIEYFGSYFYFHVLTDGSVQIKDGKYDEVVVTAAEGDSGTANTGPAANYDYTDGVFTITFVGGDEVAWENTIEHIGDMRTITYGERLAKESDIPVIDDSRLLPENPNESAMPIYNNQDGWVTTNRDAVFVDGLYAFQNNWVDDGQHYVMTRDGYWDVKWTPSFKMVKLTQTEYDNMSSHDSNTLYIIIPDTNAGA